MNSLRAALAVVIGAVLVGGCGGGGDPGDVRTIGGSVSGLTGKGLVLQLNGTYDLDVPTGASSFTLDTQLVEGTAYKVTVKSNPTDPTETCTVENGSGTMGSSAVTSIVVACSTDAYPVSATVSGLGWPGLVLDLNGEALSIDQDGSHTFSTPIASGATFTVSIREQPAAQQCLVARGSGTMASAAVTDVAVICGCSEGGWCWENPRPQANTLRSMWGSGASDVWAVGYSGTILHWNGSAWSSSSSGTTDNLYGVWGSSSSDVWAVGDAGTVLHLRR